VKFKRHVVPADGVDIVVEHVNLKHEVVSKSWIRRFVPDIPGTEGLRETRTWSRGSI
jgi:hypothetical protein